MMTQEQKNALGLWAMKMYELGQHIVEDISDVKYDGRLIIFQDGTRWEVDSMDSSTADMWSSFDKVVVIDNEMYKLDELEKVSVEQEFNWLLSSSSEINYINATITDMKIIDPKTLPFLPVDQSNFLVLVDLKSYTERGRDDDDEYYDEISSDGTVVAKYHVWHHMNLSASRDRSGLE
jgi:hypothetical protein